MSKELDEIKTLRGFNQVELNNDKNINKSLDIIEQALLEIKEANSSEALEQLKELHELAYGNDKTSWKIDEIRMSSYIKNYILKAQKVEKENQKYKQLEEKLGCPLEKFLTSNEIYSDLEDGTIKKYEIIGINFYEKKIYFWMSFVPMSVDFTDYKKYYWLKEDKSE